MLIDISAITIFFKMSNFDNDYEIGCCHGVSDDENDGAVDFDESFHKELLETLSLSNKKKLSNQQVKIPDETEKTDYCNMLSIDCKQKQERDDILKHCLQKQQTKQTNEKEKKTTITVKTGEPQYYLPAPPVKILSVEGQPIATKFFPAYYANNSYYCHENCYLNENMHILLECKQIDGRIVSFTGLTDTKNVQSIDFESINK